MLLRVIFILIYGFMVFSCDRTQLKGRPFTAFEFYYDNTWSTAFSIKFTTSDTVYIRQHFASSSGRLGAIDTSSKTNTSYIGTLSYQEQTALDSLIRFMDFSKYDTSYEEDGLKDGSKFGFYIRNHFLSKTIHIYGDSAPAELLHFGRWIADVKRSLRLVEVDSLISFEHANDWLLLPTNVDLRKFTPPQAEH